MTISGLPTHPTKTQLLSHKPTIVVLCPLNTTLDGPNTPSHLGVVENMPKTYDGGLVRWTHLEFLRRQDVRQRGWRESTGDGSRLSWLAVNEYRCCQFPFRRSWPPLTLAAGLSLHWYHCLPKQKTAAFEYHRQTVRERFCAFHPICVLFLRYEIPWLNRSCYISGSLIFWCLLQSVFSIISYYLEVNVF